MVKDQGVPLYMNNYLENKEVLKKHRLNNIMY